MENYPQRLNRGVKEWVWEVKVQLLTLAFDVMLAFLAPHLDDPLELAE